MTKGLVVGLGSAGTQHLDSLRDLSLEVAVVTSRTTGGAAFNRLSDALGNFSPDYVVIANDTASHHGSIQELIALGFQGIVLVEKPMFHENLKIPENRFKKFAVGYQLRYHPVLEKLKTIVKNEKILSAHIYCGQFLPTWRRDVDYKRSYSASSNRGGGVLRDLSHELDYALWLFGKHEVVKACGGKYSSLEIDCEDTVGFVGSFERCPLLTMQLNYTDRCVKREIHVSTETKSITCDLVKSTITVDGIVSSFEVSKKELLRAMHSDLLFGKDGPYCTPTEGKSVLELIQAIEGEL